MAEAQELPAGHFSAWLRQLLSALSRESGTSVACGECTACCTSSYFISIESEETATIGRIDKRLLTAAPGLPRGHLLLGYDKSGRCPLLGNVGCSIYEHRPRTCRAYDCRVFTAAGIAAGGDDKRRITQRAQRWKFDYPTGRDREEHAAVRAAATFIQEHPECFPGGKTPNNPSQLAILALIVAVVFLKEDAAGAPIARPPTNAAVARAIVSASRAFDEQKSRA